MQSTLFARATAINDLSPRLSSPTVGRSRTAESTAASSDSRGSIGSFANKLSNARADRENDSTRPQPAAQDAAATQAKSKDVSKPVDAASKSDRTKSSDDDTDRADSSSSGEKADASRKPKRADEAKTDVEADTDAEPKSAIEKPAKKPAVHEASPNAPALATPVTAPVAANPADAATTDEAKKGDATVTAVAVAVATSVDDAAEGATADESDTDVATAESNATTLAFKADTATDAVKPKIKIDPNTKQAAAVHASTEGLPATHDATHHEFSQKGDAEAEKDPASASTAQPDDAPAAVAKKNVASSFDDLLARLTPGDSSATPATATTTHASPVPLPTAEQRFAADNVDTVVKSVHSQIEAGGNGQMRIRLDPPELGALEVAVKMVDGRMTASFTTNNEQATQLLSHNLNTLKSSLEASGITVDRIQVRQATAGDNAQQQPSNGEHRRDGSNPFDQPSQRGDQQRKEAVQKMWRKLAYGSDELDFVA